METEGTKMTNFHEESLAIPYRVEFTLPYEEVKQEIDAYWEKNSAALIRHFKPQVKKSKGGEIPKDKARKMIESHVPTQRLYQDALAKVLIDCLQKEGRDLFHIDALNVFDYEKDKETILIGRVYYWPEMKLKENAELKFEAKFPFKPDFEKAWEGKKTELWHKHRKVSETEIDNGPVLINHDLLLDVIASCEDKPYEKGTRRGTWFELRTLNQDIREACLAHNVGDLFETSFVMTNMDPEIEGKKVRSTIKIFKAREIIYREVDDSLAVDEGFANLEALKEGFSQQYQQHIQETKRGVAVDAILSGLMAHVEVPAIPDNWMERSVKRVMQSHVAQFKGDEARAKAVVGAKDEAHFQQLFQGEVMRDILQQLVIRLYRKLYDLKDATIESLYDDMVRRCNWSDENG
jgi:FKBP-type peptidyl-prolyl cis-trans isomerase (trigger factor)